MSTQKQDITLDEVQQIVQDGSAWKVVNSLIEKGLVSVYENLQENYKAKKEIYVFLQAAFKEESALQDLFARLEKKPKQLNILLSFLHLQKTELGVLQKELLKRSEATAAQLKSMVDQGIFAVQKIETDRLRYEYHGELQVNVLSTEQEAVYQDICQQFAQQKTVLLQGVTGSGKTHVYFRLIEDCLAKGKQALYLLPEIALTGQIIRKLRSVFGDRVGIYHSRFSNNERVEVWHKVMSKKYDIVIGARSSIFLPFASIGLVIIDEEHDSSYKQQDPAPRYQARDAALYLAAQSKANVILGSATPSLESYTHALQGKYHLAKLETRYGDAVLPAVELVDIRPQLNDKKQHSIFSPQLVAAIQETIRDNKQVILFQNRRGYSPFTICSSCGWIPQCKYCDVSLTYHKVTDMLHCHTCGSRSAVMKICPACGGNRLVAKSFGTEKVEDDIRQLFPHARVQRFDWDAMRVKNKYNEIIRAFEKGTIDILVGTQMVVKGLDFEHVNLVGVLNADSLLSHPDFRVNERSFQLLEQVAGRAGRKKDIGRVLIQLYQISHPTVLQVQRHDYASFYRDEMAMRKEFLYPPFTRLIRVTLKHRQAETVLEAANQLAERLRDLPQMVLFGPAQPGVARIRNLYLQEILLKVNRDSTVLKQIKQELLRHIALLTAERAFTRVIPVIDVDPF